MKTFQSSGLGKLLLVNLDRGDLLLESIQEQAVAAGMPNAIILCAIGSLDKVHFHRVISLGLKAEDEFLRIEGPIELASLQGIILNGEPHFHMTISTLEQAYTGHLENDTRVLYRAEIVLAELKDISVRRILNDAGTMVFSDR